MSALLETEPKIPTRNFVDAFFVEASTSFPLSYALGSVLLAGVAAVIGGAYEGFSEGVRTYNMLGERNFAEAIRSGLAVLGSGVAIKAGVEVLRSAAYVMGHPLHQRLYDYRANLRASFQRQSDNRKF